MSDWGVGEFQNGADGISSFVGRQFGGRYYLRRRQIGVDFEIGKLIFGLVYFLFQPRDFVLELKGNLLNFRTRVKANWKAASRIVFDTFAKSTY